MPIVSIIITLPSMVKPEAVCKSLNPIDVPTPPYAEMISHATVKILTWGRLRKWLSDPSGTFNFHLEVSGSRVYLFTYTEVTSTGACGK
jgi:hypothetical protein